MIRAFVRLSSLPGCENGASTLEFAIVLPALLAVFIGMMEVAWIGWAKNTLDFTVQETARCVAIRADLCGTTAQAQAFAVAQASGIAITPADVAISSQPCGVQVSAQADAGFVAYVLPTHMAKLTATTCRAGS